MIHFIICTLVLLAFASLVNSTETLNSTVQDAPQLAPVPIGPKPVPGVFTSKRPTALTNGIGGPRVCWSPADDPGAVWCSFTTDYVTYTHRQMTKSKAAGCSEENYGTAGIAMSPVNDDLNMYLYVCTGANSLAMMSFLDGTPSAPVCLDHFYEAVNCLGSVSALYLLGAPSWIVGFYKHNDGDMWTFRHHPGLGIAGGVSLDPNVDTFKIADAPGLYRKDDTDEVQVFYHKVSTSSPPQLFRTIYTISTLKFGFGQPLSIASSFSNVPFTLIPRPGRIYFPDKRYVLMYPFTTSTARGFSLDTTYDQTMLTGWSTFFSQTAQQPNTSCSEVVLYQKPTAPYTSWFGCWYTNTSGALIWFGLIY